MRHLFLFSLLMLVLSVLQVVADPAAKPSTPAPSASPAVLPAVVATEDNVHVALRAHLFDFAGIMSQEAFKFRDGHWAGRLESGVPQRLQINLFSGNQYWLALAVQSASSAKMRVYLPDGKLLKTLEYAQGGLLAAGFTAPMTGQYFVELLSSNSATPFAFFYLYK